jgi:hypothetical protein
VIGGEPVTVIGFPRTPPVPWAVTPGAMTGQTGQNLVFSGAAVSGNSGGPLVVDRKVVGVVTEVTGQYGYAVPVPIVRVALRGWGVTLGGALKDTSQTVPEAPAPKETEKPLSREITGKDGAPMILIPAGEFWMGSQDGEGEKDEHPRHRVSLGRLLETTLTQLKMKRTRKNTWAYFLLKVGNLVAWLNSWFAGTL